MPVPALMSAAPIALEFLRAFLTADENAKKHEIALAERELEAMRIHLESSKISLDREYLQARVHVYDSFLSAMKSTFDSKAELLRAIEVVVLSQHQIDKEEIRKSRRRLQRLLQQDDAPPNRLSAARREMASINERERDLETRFGEIARQFQSTIIALSPSDFSTIGSIRGYIS